MISRTSPSLTDVEATINLGRDRTDFRSQVLFHHPQGVAVIIGDQIHGQSQVTESSRPSNTVKVRLGVLGEVKVDNDVHTLNIDTAREEIGRHEVTRTAVAEFVEDAVTIGLLHLGMYVEAGVSQLGDFLGEELDAVDRVAEDDGLVNLQLGKKSIEAVDLLPFLDVGVELGDTPKGELLHQIDRVGFGDVLLAEFLDGHGEGSAEEAYLMRLVAEVDNFLEDWLEFGGEELVGLVHDDGAAFA